MVHRRTHSSRAGLLATAAAICLPGHAHAQSGEPIKIGVIAEFPDFVKLSQ